MTQDITGILCPYCGHSQRRMDVCEICGGHFDPLSRRGMQVNMGPWFLRDEHLPFRPPFSYASLARLMAAGKLTADSILRGPSTQQWWRPARDVPGIAHLLGFCHHCHSPAAPSQSQCDRCGKGFAAVTAHNEMGLPFNTSAEARLAQKQLDLELARSAGDVPHYEPQRDGQGRVLCHYCGHTQDALDRCETCGGLFDALSRRATHLSMGPWFVRNKRHPFLPGCSYDVLCKRIETERVDGGTILRGPTTRQFWAIARNVPGVSHLVGHCHACGADFDRGAASCPACGLTFPVLDQSNLLGLPFPTQVEAEAAQRQLEAQFLPQGPPVPAPAPRWATRVVPGMRGESAAQAAREAMANLGPASLAALGQAPGASKIAKHNNDDEFVEAELDDAPASAGPLQAALPADAGPSFPPSTAGADGRQLLALGAVVVVTVSLAAALIFIHWSQPGPDPAAPVAKHAPPTFAQLLAAAAEAGEGAKIRWEKIKDVDSAGGIGFLLPNVEDLLRRGQAMVDDDDPAQALPLFKQAIDAITVIESKVRQREIAQVARARAIKNLTQANQLPPVGEQIAALTAALREFEAGQIAFDRGDFVGANAAWDSAASQLSALAPPATEPAP